MAVLFSNRPLDRGWGRQAGEKKIPPPHGKMVAKHLSLCGDLMQEEWCKTIQRRDPRARSSTGAGNIPSHGLREKG